MRTEQPPPADAARHRLLGAALVVVMAAGSILMWVGVPVGWMWLGSRMTSSTQAQLGPYLLVLLGTIVSMIAIGKGLGVVNRLHMQVTGRLDDRRTQATWMRSMRGERRVVRDRGVLDGVMLVSVGLAVVAFVIWFFVFAGSSLPT
ncbi:MAG TPA: hypothetical protein VFT50_05100 [Baekduia sp.]|nr:hypothetical protein [Baekduia sp.]